MQKQVFDKETDCLCMNFGLTNQKFAVHYYLKALYLPSPQQRNMLTFPLASPSGESHRFLISKISPLGQLHAFTHGGPLPTFVIPGPPLLSEGPTEAGNVALTSTNLLARLFGTKAQGCLRSRVAVTARALKISVALRESDRRSGWMEAGGEEKKKALTSVQKVTGTDQLFSSCVRLREEAVEACGCYVTRAARDLDPFEIGVRSAD